MLEMSGIWLEWGVDVKVSKLNCQKEEFWSWIIDINLVLMWEPPKGETHRITVNLYGSTIKAHQQITILQFCENCL